MPSAAGPESDQIALVRSLMCAGARRNPATCGTHQGARKRGFALRRRALAATLSPRKVTCLMTGVIRSQLICVITD